ncbi:MAG: hypothetical protein ABIU09_06680 [Pyrinomonadaceae bacterium]
MTVCPPDKKGGTNMVRQSRTNIARKIEKASPNNASALKSPKKQRPAKDDIILSLANAHENRRARQVFEWENVQPVNVQQAV